MGYAPPVNSGRADLPAVPLVRTDLAEPTVADRYELRSVLGSGGMGTVWEAFDIRLGRTVALKVLRDDLPPSAALQLEREARAAARILDPRVVTVLDLARTADGNPYLVLECHDGNTLADELREGPLPPTGSTGWSTTCSARSGAAHRCGVLHRDVKPSNVLAGADGFRVTDFGLASLDDDQTTETDIMGTLVYVAPERLDGARGSTRSDVFSAAVVIHEAATGVQPFRREQAVESIAALRTGDAPALPDTLPEGLRSTLRAALSPDPDDRPQDATAMLEQIRSAVPPAPLGPDPTIRLDATSVLPGVSSAASTVEVPVADGAPPVTDPAGPALERTVFVPDDSAAAPTVDVPPAPVARTPDPQPRPEPVLPPQPRPPGPFDDARRFLARHGRRPEVVIGTIAASLLVLLLLAVLLDGGDDDDGVVDTGPDAPATLDETLDRIEELGR